MSHRTRRPAAALAPALLLLLTACSGASADAGESGGDVVRIGVTGAEDTAWQVFTEKAAAQGITVELRDFSDYQLPNQALADGDIDTNSFQHLAFLAQFNVARGTDIEPVGSTLVVPLSLYSQRHASVDEIPQGGQIAIPNDAANLGRGLKVLESAGLVVLDPGAGLYPTVEDITDNPRGLEIVQVDATQTVPSLPDVDGAIINNTFLAQAGLSQSDAIFADDPESEASRPYVNVFAVDAADVDEEVYQELVEIYHDPEVEEAVVADSGGSAVVIEVPAEELRATLADIEQQLQDA